MSDYELADLFLAQTSAVMTYFMNFISVTSALLAVGYFAGKSLPSGLARAVVWIYAISSVVIITGTNRNLANVAAIRDQMGSGLKWHKALADPAWFMPAMIWGTTLSMVAIFLAALWYFSYVRTHGDTNT